MAPVLEAWKRIDPRLIDGALAVALFVLAQAQADPGQRWLPLSVVLVALETLPLAFRRVRPATVMVVVSLALLAHLGFGFHNQFFDTFAGVVAIYSVAAHSRRNVSLLFLAALPIGLGAALAVDWHNKGSINLLDLPYNLLLFVSGWVLGDNLQTRRAYAAQLEERERLLERERAKEARATLAEERARIARELHDIVAHTVSVMVLQANAGERIVGSRPEQAAQNFTAIQSTGRQALTELRRLLGILRGDESSDGARGPQPGLAEIEQLADGARQSGLETTLTMNVDGDDLPDTLQLSAYRVVQEALTNTMRHAGASQVRITVQRESTALDIEVVDDGRREVASLNGTATGHGLVGMRERVQLFDGELEAGPVPAGGFRIHARFPLA